MKKKGILNINLPKNKDFFSKKSFYRFRETLILTGIIAVLLLLFSNSLNNLDKSLNEIKFKVRGEQKLDSNIVVLYIDRAIMDSLGRVPLEWNYYSRVINALSFLRVKSIGIDNIFDENSPDFPNQASLLLSAVMNSNAVCVGGFFQELNFIDKNDSTFNEIFSKFYSDNILKDSLKSLFIGEKLSKPFPQLIKVSDGFGHLNFSDGLIITKVPSFIFYNEEEQQINEKKDLIIPSFALEMLRIYFELPKDSIQFFKNKIEIRNDVQSIIIPTTDNEIEINYLSSNKSIKKYSVTDFMRMYYAYNYSGKYEDEMKKFEGKIVIIGTSAEGVNQFYATPLEEKEALSTIQANIINTILQKRFIYYTPYFLTFLISILLSFIIFNLMSGYKIYQPILWSISIIIVYTILLFVLFSFDISISFQPIILAIFSIIISWVYKTNVVFIHTKRIEIEKKNIEEKLVESKSQVNILKNEIEQRKTNGNETLLEIQQSEQKINELSLTMEDLSDYNFNGNSIYEFEGIVFTSDSKMVEIIDTIKKIAPTDATILVTGESGTGKELVAKAIHNISLRNENKFVAINCGAITESILESELFGYEAGAFTGANKMKKGLFEVADKGTIFLDEITETSEFFQTKLLRIIQSGEFNRVGGTETLKVDVRIIAASNKPVEKLVQDGKFREDLFYRLNVIRIHLPALRERKSDINALVRSFLKKENKEELKISNAVMEIFFNYDWPGNIRQLESVIKRAVILTDADKQKLIRLKYIPQNIFTSLKGKVELGIQILDSLRAKGFKRNSISETARELGGLNRSTISEYLRGIFFKEFSENNFNIDITIKIISSSDDEETLKRVKKKFLGYLNILEKSIDKEKPLDEVKDFVNQKFRKMPLKYHFYLEEITEKIYNNILTFEIESEELENFDED